MGNQLRCCQAIQSAQFLGNVGTAEQQKQKFFEKYPSIQRSLNNYNYPNELQQSPVKKLAHGIFIGPLSPNHLPHCAYPCLFLYHCGFLYYGLIKNGQRHGKGLLINQDGQFYDGNWQGNQPTGYGKYQGQGKVYQGMFVQGLQDGKGKETYEDGTSYQGDFVKGIKHGTGTLIYPDNTSYVGDFQQGLIHGAGISLSPFHRYEGSWSQGKIHGHGISTFFNLKNQIIGSYMGQYQKGLKHGYGQYKWGEIKVYKGNWVEGQMSGDGIIIDYKN